ncbi:MAG: tetratricopeptide repeat protein [Bacteroidales bacterium]|nr:tetratricopeptide repeat protein [Bacteroidales bacterium]
MKKVITISACILFALSLFAGKAEELAQKAEDCFKQSQYEEAVAYYDSIVQMNYSSSHLYFNMGNCYYRLNDIANSVYYYEKALMYDPSNEDAEFNLNLVNKQLEIEIVPALKPFYDRVDEYILTFMSADAWAIVSYVNLFLIMVGFVLFLFFSKLIYRQVGFSMMMIFLFWFGHSILFTYKMSKFITDNEYAIVYETSMVKSSPNVEAVNSFEVCEGMKVMVSDSVNNMYNVKLLDNKTGWIDKKDVRLLSE